MKNKFLKIAVLSTALLLVGCDDIVANPKNGSGALVTFSDGSTYFQNDYQKVYDELVDSSDFNTLTFDALLNKIIEDKVYGDDFFKNVDDLKNSLIEEQLLTTLDSDSYKIDKLFSEEKFLNTINASLYNISVETTHENVSIRPDTTVSDLLGDDYLTTYKAYIDDQIVPSINKKLLTAKYICQNSFSSLGRAYARRISYIKLENMDKQPGAASQLITKWLGDFVEKGKTTSYTVNDDGTKTYSFDLDSLARIYKGVTAEGDIEKDYADGLMGDFYTLSDEITDEINKICDVANNYQMKLDIDIDTTIEDKYTSSGTYTLAWGHELALRDLDAKKISDTDLYTKTNGISDLPSDVTDRLFSSSVSSYYKSAYYMPETNDDPYEKDENGDYKLDDNGNKVAKEGAVEVKFLTPLTSENGSDLSNYYFYDSSTDAYYIVVLQDYSFTSTNLKNDDDTKLDDDGNVVGVGEDTARIAVALSSSSSYSSEAILDVLEEYDIANHIHDQNFYDYMEENYSDIFDD